MAGRPRSPRHREYPSYEHDGRYTSSSSKSRPETRMMDIDDDGDVDAMRGSDSHQSSHYRHRHQQGGHHHHHHRHHNQRTREDYDDYRRRQNHNRSDRQGRDDGHRRSPDRWYPTSSSATHDRESRPRRDSRDYWTPTSASSERQRERNRDSHHSSASRDDESRRRRPSPSRVPSSPSRRHSIDEEAPRSRNDQHRHSRDDKEATDSRRRSRERSTSSSQPKRRELLPDRPSESSSSSSGLSIKGSSKSSMSIKGASSNTDAHSQPEFASPPPEKPLRQGPNRVFDVAMSSLASASTLDRADVTSPPRGRKSIHHGHERRDGERQSPQERPLKEEQSRHGSGTKDDREVKHESRRSLPSPNASGSRSSSPPKKMQRKLLDKDAITNGSNGKEAHPSDTAAARPSEKPHEQATTSKMPDLQPSEPSAQSLMAPPMDDQDSRGSPAKSTVQPIAALAEVKPPPVAESSQNSEVLPPPPVNSKTPTPPPPAEEPPPAEVAPSPPPPQLQSYSTAAERRLGIRSRLKPLAERTFVGSSQTSAYRKVDDSEGGLLGVGTFGEVSRARHIETGADVALKKIKFQANDASNGMPITAIREIKLLKRLAHPNVCPVIDMVYEPASSPTGAGTVYMVLPYMQHDLNGLLERLDSEDKPFTPAQIKLYMKQLLEGTLYLHQNKILHRDIKAANILISNDGSLRIADFGLARAYHDPGDDTHGGIPAWKMDARTGQSGWKGGDVNYTGMVVTRWYRPPELLAGERKYGPAVDMWGMGCLLAEMILRRPLFKGSCEVNQLELIADLCGSPDDATYPGWTSLPGVKNFDHNGKSTDERGRVDFGRKRRMVRERFQGMVRTELADLIDKLLILDPRKRLTAEGALRHPWFDVEPLPADPASLPQYPESRESTKVGRPTVRPTQGVAGSAVPSQQPHSQQGRPPYVPGGFHGAGPAMMQAPPPSVPIFNGQQPPRGPAAGGMMPYGPPGGMHGGPGPRPPFNPYAQHNNPYAGGAMGGPGGMRR